MQLFRTHQLPPLVWGDERVVKEWWFSRLLYALAFLAMTLGATASGIYIVYAWFTDQMPAKFKGLAPFFGLAFCLLFALVGLALLRSTLRRSNWLMRLRSEEIIIKFRSDYNDHLPEPDPVVLSLTYGEIAWARQTHEWVRVPSLSADEAPSRYRAHFLGLKLRLSAEQLAPFRQALAAEMHYRLGKGRGSSLTRHYPVRLDGDVLRVQWWGALRPRLEQTLDWLRQRVMVERELDLTVDLTEGSRADTQTTIAELARRGETLAAIGLARRVHGLSLAAAKRLVENLDLDA